MVQCRDEGEAVSVAVRGHLDQSRATLCLAVQADNGGRGPGLVAKDKPRVLDPPAMSLPGDPPPSDVGAAVSSRCYSWRAT
jgi:hypothetical protein